MGYGPCIEEATIGIKRVQHELVEWAERNFPNRGFIEPLLGVQEELGELTHHVLKRMQGIRGSAEEHDAGIRDAVADVVIFLADFCNAEGIDLEQTVVEVWDTEVKPRDWRKSGTETLDTQA